MNSRDSLPIHVLARPSASRLRKMLDDLVNLPDDSVAAGRFERRFGDMFLPDVPPMLITQWKGRIYEEDAADLSDNDFLWKHWLPSLRNAVRVVWKSPDYRLKHWGVFRILEKYFAIGDRSISSGPVQDSVEWLFGSLGSPIPFELALMRLLKAPQSTRFCANPDCGAPYFWAEHASQRYCSPPCGRRAQRESKRIWWEANGPEWRRARAVEQKQRRKKTSPRSQRRAG